MWLALGGIGGCDAGTSTIVSGGGAGGSSSSTGGGGFGGVSSSTGGNGVSGNGSGGEGGSGGAIVPPICPISQYQICPSCGNGQIDVCVPSPGEGIPEVPENCDGAIGSATCTSLGYANGALSCLSSCAFDTSQCTRCAPPNGPILQCINAPLASPTAGELALAATDQEIGLVWRTLDNPEGVHFARFASDLSLLSKTDVPSSICPRGIAIASTPSGWLVAAGSPAGIELSTLDGNGAVQGTSLLSTVVNGAVLLAGRSNGGPLLVWRTKYDEARFVVVSTDGKSTTSPGLLKEDFIDNHFRAIFVQNGFLLAFRRSLTGVGLVRITVDGMQVGNVTSPVGSETENPELAAQDPNVLLAYDDFSGGIGTTGARWAKLDAMGNLIAGPAVLGVTPDYFGAAPIWAAGSKSAVALAGHTGIVDRAGYLDFARLDGSGAILGAPQRIVADPALVSGQVAVRRGSDMVVAWLNHWNMPVFDQPAGIGMARISP